MKALESFENKKGNKLIFRQRTSDIPSLGSVVLIERENFKIKSIKDGKKENFKNKSGKEGKYSEIGKIIDVFGPVKEPWVIVNLFKNTDMSFENLTFFWKKEGDIKKKKFKDKKKFKKKY